MIKELNEIAKLKNFSYKNKFFKKLKKKVIFSIKKNFNSKYKKINLTNKINIFHPKVSFGNISSLNLLEIDELLIFKFYLRNYSNYKKIIDIGANIGLHSIINSKLGLKVESYEPDPWHFKLMRENIEKNKVKKIKIIKAAVSNKFKLAHFTRVLGNTTGSHLTGAKKEVYNETEKFTVRVVPISQILKKEKCLVKIDAEGEEARILNSLKKKHLIGNDFICEVGSKDNAKIIYQKLKKEKINSYAQKINFKKVKKLSDIPTSYKEGSLFISSKNIWKI